MRVFTHWVLWTHFTILGEIIVCAGQNEVLIFIAEIVALNRRKIRSVLYEQCIFVNFRPGSNTSVAMLTL